MRRLSKLFTSTFVSVWGQKDLEHTGLCSAGVYPSSSALCVISLLHKENLPGIWMDGPCQCPPGLSASHQSIHLISSKPLDFKLNVPHDSASPVVILINTADQSMECLWRQPNIENSLVSHASGYLCLWLNLQDPCLLVSWLSAEFSYQAENNNKRISADTDIVSNISCIPKIYTFIQHYRTH